MRAAFGGDMLFDGGDHIGGLNYLKEMLRGTRFCELEG